MEVEEVCCDYCSSAFYVRGHVDFADFYEALAGDGRVQNEYPLDHSNLEACFDGDFFIFYTWLRFNPDSSGEYLYLIGNGTPGKQGSFPATIFFTDEYWDFKRFKRMPELVPT